MACIRYAGIMIASLLWFATFPAGAAQGSGNDAARSGSSVQVVIERERGP